MNAYLAKLSFFVRSGGVRFNCPNCNCIFLLSSPQHLGWSVCYECFNHQRIVASVSQIRSVGDGNPYTNLVITKGKGETNGFFLQIMTPPEKRNSDSGLIFLKEGKSPKTFSALTTIIESFKGGSIKGIGGTLTVTKEGLRLGVDVGNRFRLKHVNDTEVFFGIRHKFSQHIPSLMDAMLLDLSLSSQGYQKSPF